MYVCVYVCMCVWCISLSIKFIHFDFEEGKNHFWSHCHGKCHDPKTLFNVWHDFFSSFFFIRKMKMYWEKDLRNKKKMKWIFIMNLMHFWHDAKFVNQKQILIQIRKINNKKPTSSCLKPVDSVWLVDGIIKKQKPNQSVVIFNSKYELIFMNIHNYYVYCCMYYTLFSDGGNVL